MNVIGLPLCRQARKPQTLWKYRKAPEENLEPACRRYLAQRSPLEGRRAQ
jgi:hypothetical protein